MELLVISHFYNEEFLLPFWLDHHTKLFDHGVMIDYKSTDMSVEIIREIAPTWEVRPSINNFFGAEACDLEVMSVEDEFNGVWKVVLNVTEFIITRNLRRYIQNFDENHQDSLGFLMVGGNVVENPKELGVLTDEPLVFQKKWGYLQPQGPRCRLVHKAKNGQYRTGRHQTDLEGVRKLSSNVFCMWFGYCPWPGSIPRKLQIQNKIPEEDKKRGLGAEHIVGEQALNERWEQETKNCVDLMEISGYRDEILGMRREIYGL